MTATLSEQRRVAAVAFIREAVERHGGNETAAADELGISQQLVNRALKTGVIGVQSVQRMANKKGQRVAGIEPDAPDVRSVPERGAVIDDEFASRPAALEMARQLGRNPIAIAGVAKLRPKHDADPGMKGWLDLVDEAEAALKGRLPSTPSDDTNLMSRPDPTPRRRAAK